MRKRLATLVLSLTALAVLVPAAPASATTCYIGEPDVGDVMCLVYGTPGVIPLCKKLVVC